MKSLLLAKLKRKEPMITETKVKGTTKTRDKTHSCFVIIARLMDTRWTNAGKFTGTHQPSSLILGKKMKGEPTRLIWLQVIA